MQYESTTNDSLLSNMKNIYNVLYTIENTLQEDIGDRFCTEKSDLRTKWNVILAYLPPPPLFTNFVVIRDKYGNVGWALRCQGVSHLLIPTNVQYLPPPPLPGQFLEHSVQ